MPSLEERVAYLEGQVSQQSHLERRMDARFDSVDRRLDGTDRRLDAMGARIDALDAHLSHRMQSIEDGLSRRIDEMSGRLDTLDEKVSRQFVWLVGVQVTTLVAIVGALLTKG